MDEVGWRGRMERGRHGGAGQESGRSEGGRRGCEVGEGLRERERTGAGRDLEVGVGMPLATMGCGHKKGTDKQNRRRQWRLYSPSSRPASCVRVQL